MPFPDAANPLSDQTSPPDQYVPLIERLHSEIAMLKKRRQEAATPVEAREISTWIDEAYCELHRAMRREISPASQ